MIPGQRRAIRRDRTPIDAGSFHRCLEARRRGELPGGSRADLISIVDANPDLAELLDEAEREGAQREALTRMRQLSPGVWDATKAVEPDLHHRGFRIIGRLLSREVEVLRGRCVELLGPVDVMRPWRSDPDGSHVHAEVGWRVL